MDRKPLIATEASSILLNDCSHSIEKLPNLPILLHSLLSSHTNNMATNSTDCESTHPQEPSLIKELPSITDKEATSLSEVKPQEERATDEDENSQEQDNSSTSTPVEPGDASDKSALPKQDLNSELQAVERKEASPQVSSSSTTSQEVTVVSAVSEKDTQVGKDEQTGCDQSDNSHQASLQPDKSSGSPTQPDRHTVTAETENTETLKSSKKRQSPPLAMDSPSPKQTSVDSVLASKESTTTVTVENSSPSVVDQQTRTVKGQSPPVDKEGLLPIATQVSPPAPPPSLTTAKPASPQAPPVVSVPETAPSDSLKTTSNNNDSSTPSIFSISTDSSSTTASLTTNSLFSSMNNPPLLSSVLTTSSPMSVISSTSVPLPAHVPVVKSTLQKITTHAGSREQAPLVTLGAEKLTVGQAETLQASANLMSQQKQIKVKSREETSERPPPQVAVIPPLIDPSKVQDFSRFLGSQPGQEGLKKSLPGHDVGGGVAGMEKTVTVPHIPTHREVRSAEGKSPHQVARRIWMSSCRPLDPASLERIGVDSKGNVYWYDGGKNMFLSPASTDPAYKPSESELQLVCKSMVQWTAKLKELRMSNDQQMDIKLAQTIKDQFMSRVRVATQRKPRDVSVLQNLQAVHTGSAIKHSQLSKQHIVAMTSTDSSKNPQFVPSAFPQGSILVVPHGGAPFHTVLPMFGSTAMIMPQAVTGTTAVAGKGNTISLPAVNSVGSKVVTAAAPSAVIQSGSSGDSVTIEDGKKADGEKKDDSKPAAVVLTTDQAKSLFSKQSTINMPVIVPPSLAGGVLPSVLQNYQQAFAFYSPVCALKVSEPVKMEEVSFECKSIEISGEVPIKKILIDESKEEDIEVIDSVTEQPKQPGSSEFKAEEGIPTQLASFAGHSSAEVMSAQLLLSLKGRSDNWNHTPQDTRGSLEQKAALSKPLTREEAIAISTPITTSSSSTPSSSRKRKQTPIASAKPSAAYETPPGSKVKRGRKAKAEDDKATPRRRAAPKKNAKVDPAIPNQLLPGESPLQPQTADSLETSQATASMLQLKASRTSKPMKEYVIETDSDSDNSSSGSSSSHSNSESSSESSSDSSSEEEAPPPNKSVTNRGRGRGRGRGGRGRGGTTLKAQTQPKGSSDESGVDVDPKRAPKAQSKRGGRGSAQSGRGTQRKPARKPQEHIVSIPTDLLSSKQMPGKKRKSQDGDPEKLVDGNKRTSTEFGADVPTDLASLYAKKGGVDLSILSELTQSVGASGGGELPSRSKRTCVRVRQQITKLQEILGDEADIRSPGSAGSKVKGRGTVRPPANRSSDTGQSEVVSAVSPKKYKRPAYSQFTHKRRKRRKKSPEEEPLWQPAQQPSGEKLTPVYVFSTSWANKAAAAVENGVFDNIVKFHKAQPKGPGYHVLDSQSRRRKPPPSAPPPKDSPEESEKEEELEKKAPPKSGQKGKAKAPPPKKSPATRGGRKSSTRKSPPIPRAFLRSSSRLRKQRNEPDPEDFHSSPEESSSHPTPSPSPSPPLQPAKRTRASTGGRASTRTTRNSRKKQLSPESFVQEDSESDSQSPVTKTDPPSENDRYKSEDEETPTKKVRLDSSKPVEDSVGSSPDAPSKVEPSAPKKDEVNYTICHGTPGDRRDSETDLQQHDTYPRPKGPLPVTSLATTTPSETVLSPEMSGAKTTTPRAQHPPGTTEQRPQSKGNPTDPSQTQREASAWNPNLSHQFPGVAPGYPSMSMYNPALHGMHYPGSAAPGIHGSNYPYPMPYPWAPGTHSHIGASQDPSRHAAHTGESPQYMRGGEANASPALTHAAHASSAAVQQQMQQRQQLQSTRPAYTPDGQGIQKAPAMERPTLSHSPSLHPLTSPVSGSSPLAHQTAHGYVQSPGNPSSEFHFGSHNHPSHPPPFPYGFEHSAASLQQMHLWQSQQPHLSQIAGIRGSHIPTHMPAHGLWYSPTQPMPHFMQGGEIPAHYKKSAGKTAKPLPPDKAGANRNTNNNNDCDTRPNESEKFLNVGPHLAKYHAKAFPTSSAPPIGSSFSLGSVSSPH